MRNDSGLSPLGRAVLCEPWEPEREGSIIVLTESAEDVGHMLDVKVRVVEVGPHCWPNEPQRARPGEVVMVARMSGWLAKGPRDGRKYRLVNDNDVFCRINTGE